MVRLWFESLQNSTAHKRPLVQGNLFFLSIRMKCLSVCASSFVVVVRCDWALWVIAFGVQTTPNFVSRNLEGLFCLTPAATAVWGSWSGWSQSSSFWRITQWATHEHYFTLLCNVWIISFWFEKEMIQKMLYSSNQCWDYHVLRGVIQCWSGFIMNCK